MFCKNCGTELTEDNLFCPECGERVDAANQSPELAETVFIEEIALERAAAAALEQTTEEAITAEVENTYEEPAEEMVTAEAENTYEEPVMTQEPVIEEMPVPEVQNVYAEPIIEETPVIPAAGVKYCHNCGAANAENTDFCGNCGVSLRADAPTFTAAEQPKKKFALNLNMKALNMNALNMKYVIIGAGAAAALIIVVGILFAVILGGSKDKPLLYLKDNEINSVLKKNKTYVVSEDIYSDRDYISGLYDATSYQIQLTKDNKYIFYPKEKTPDGRFDLYRREYGKEKGEETKVDSDVSSYYIIDGNRVFYIKDSSANRLYFSNLKKDKEKIASDVSWFRISDNKKYILWETYDEGGKLYVQDISLKKEKIKIDSDISYIAGISKDFKNIVYRKDDILYVMRDFEEKEKIASSVVDEYVYFQENEDMEIYYRVEDNTESAASEESADLSAFHMFVNDDLAAEDANITIPNENNYRKTGYVQEPQYDWYSGRLIGYETRENTVTDWDAYNADYEKYNKKEERDSLRQHLANTLSPYAAGSVEEYYYSDATKKNERILEDSVRDELFGGAVMLYSVLDQENIEQVNFSALIGTDDYIDFYQAEERARNAALSNVTVKMCYKGKLTVLDIDWDEYGSVARLETNEKAKMCYLLLQRRTEDYSTEYALFKTGFKSDGSLEAVADECGNMELVTDDGVYYTADLDDNGAGDLYFNDKKIDSDVDADSCRKLEKGGVMYLTDPGEGGGTLYQYTKKDPEKIAADVVDYVEQDNGSIALLTDYNFSKYRGDLKVYYKGKLNAVDSDVASIVRPIQH